MKLSLVALMVDAAFLLLYLGLDGSERRKLTFFTLYLYIRLASGKSYRFCKIL